MPLSESAPRSRTVLIGNSQEWFSRSLETVLQPSGYVVVRAYTGRSTLAEARRSPPDAIILASDFPDMSGLELCRTLRAESVVSPATPIWLTTAAPVTKALRLEALRAGAWELRGEHLDAEELALRLDAFVAGKLEADRLDSLLDLSSGLYNAAGSRRRSQELASLAARQGLALSCVLFRAQEPTVRDSAADDLARAFKAHGRSSDVVGRLGPAEFVVFAPATDARGAERLVQRLTQAVARALPLKTAHTTALPPHRTPPDPEALLARTREALRDSAADD